MNREELLCLMNPFHDTHTHSHLIPLAIVLGCPHARRFPVVSPVQGAGAADPGIAAAYPPKPDGAVRFVCVSDTHGLTGSLQLPAGDVLLHGSTECVLLAWKRLLKPICDWRAMR